MRALEWILSLGAIAAFTSSAIVARLAKRRRAHHLDEGKRLRSWMDEMGYDE